MLVMHAGLYDMIFIMSGFKVGGGMFPRSGVVGDVLPSV